MDPLCGSSPPSPASSCNPHELRYHSGMDTTVVQVRDVPVSVLATLKARAEARGISLSSFLRDLMASEAAMPPIDDVMSAIASREPVSYDSGDLRSFRED